MARGTTRSPRRSDEDTTPGPYPDAPPSPYQLATDSSFTLQTVMELQKSVGEISAKVDRLIGDVRSQGDKIDRMRLTFAWVGGGCALVLAVMAFLPASVREEILRRLWG